MEEENITARDMCELKYDRHEPEEQVDLTQRQWVVMIIAVAIGMPLLVLLVSYLLGTA